MRQSRTECHGESPCTKSAGAPSVEGAGYGFRFRTEMSLVFAPMRVFARLLHNQRKSKHLAWNCGIGMRKTYKKIDSRMPNSTTVSQKMRTRAAMCQKRITVANGWLRLGTPVRFEKNRFRMIRIIKEIIWNFAVKIFGKSGWSGATWTDDLVSVLYETVGKVIAKISVSLVFLACVYQKHKEN